MLTAFGKSGSPRLSNNASSSAASTSMFPSATRTSAGPNVERELKSWAATEAKAVEAMLRENERNAKKAAKAESDRRAALAKKTHQKFRVVAKSTNLGGFGLRQYILRALTAPPGRSSGATCTPGKEGKSLTFRWSTASQTGAVSPEFECPERMPDCQPV